MENKMLKMQKYLPVILAALGLLGAMMKTRVPQLLVLPSLLAAVLALWGADQRKGSYGENFPASALGAFGHFFLGGCLGATAALCQPAMEGILGSAWQILGWAGCGCCILAGFLRFQGKKPNFILYLGLCAFLTLHIITHYQSWSSTPALLGYLFPLLGTLALLFFCYYTMAWTVQLGSRKMQLMMGFLSIYLTILAMPGSGYPLLYLGGFVFSLTGLCKLGATL